MDLTLITASISLAIIATCSIISVVLLWRRNKNTVAIIERVVIWITFLLVIISLGMMTLYKVPNENTKVDFSLLASVMAILVTVLVGWQVWQALISREQLRDIEQRLRDLELNISNKIKQAVLDYDVENRIEQNYIMGRSSIQIHAVVDILNEYHKTGVKTDLINVSSI